MYYHSYRFKVISHGYAYEFLVPGFGTLRPGVSHRVW